MIKRKWPKIDQGGPWTPLRRQAVQGGSGLARHWFHGRFQASALPLVRRWAVLRSVRLLEGPGSLGGLGPAANDVSSVARKESLCAVQLGIQKAFSPHPTQGVASAQIPPRTAGGLGRGGPRRLAISFALRAAEIEIPPEGRGAHGGTGPPVRADLPRRGGPSAEGPRPRGAPAWPAACFAAGSKPPHSPW